MKAVVLFSGGIDSTTCLAEAVAEFGSAEVMALTLTYGQKHDTEMESAELIAAHYDVEHVVKDLSEVFTMTKGNPLLGDGEMPTGTYADQQREDNEPVSTYVPFRNGLFLSYATAIAYSVGASYVIYGAHADDAAGSAYPDCSPDFVAGMGEAIGFGTGEKVQLRAPLIALSKADVIAIGLSYDAPYHYTWSCYEGRSNENGFACGKCSTCIDRREAFLANGIVDPINYEV